MALVLYPADGNPPLSHGVPSWIPDYEDFDSDDPEDAARWLREPQSKEAPMPQTRTKQLVAAIGAVAIVVFSAVATGEFDVPEIVQSVLALLTVVGVGEVPNQPKD